MSLLVRTSRCRPLAITGPGWSLAQRNGGERGTLRGLPCVSSIVAIRKRKTTQQHFSNTDDYGCRRKLTSAAIFFVVRGCVSVVGFDAKAAPPQGRWSIDAGWWPGSRWLRKRHLCHGAPRFGSRLVTVTGFSMRPCWKAKSANACQRWPSHTWLVA